MRSSALDNAKAALIFLVVLGHFLEAADGWAHTWLRPLLLGIYLFHMPAFVFLAGITAKQDRLLQRVARIAVMFGMFQLAYMLPALLITGELPTRLVQPYWILWFLLSLIWWMLLLPVINRVPGALLYSVAIAVVAGALPVNSFVLSLGRTLVFLPFFVAGHLYGKQILAWLHKPSVARLAGIPVLLGCVALIVQADPDHRWLQGSYFHPLLGVADTQGVLIRAGLLLLSSLSVLAFLALIPRGHGWASGLGQRSLAIFVLHGFIVKAWGAVYPLFPITDSLTLLTLVLASSLATTLILGLAVFDRAVRSVSEAIVNAPAKLRAAAPGP